MHMWRDRRLLETFPCTPPYVDDPWAMQTQMNGLLVVTRAVLNRYSNFKKTTLLFLFSS